MSCQSVVPGFAFSSAMMPRLSAAAETPAPIVVPSAAVAEDFRKPRREMSDSPGEGRFVFLFMEMGNAGDNPDAGRNLGRAQFP